MNSTITSGNSTMATELVTRDIFMEEVETFTTFKVATYINRYWFPVLVPIGLVGNTLSFLVMIKPNNRKMSTCIYMAAISINDNLMMFSALHNWLVTVVKVHEWQQMECKAASFVGLHVVQNGTFQVVAMTIDKYVAIRWPHKAATYSTPRRAKLTVICIYVFVLLYNVPHFFMSNLTGDACLGYALGGVITKVYSWFSFVLNAIIPLVLLIFMNSVIVNKVRESHKMFQTITNETCATESQRQKQGQSPGHNLGQGQGHNTAASRREKARKSTENQLTIMLLLVTVLFLILMIPTYIRFLYTTFMITDTSSKYANLMFFYHISHKLYHTNNGINFFLYCISGQKFRKDLNDLFCCSTEKRNSFVSSHSVSVISVTSQGKSFTNLSETSH